MKANTLPRNADSPPWPLRLEMMAKAEAQWPLGHEWVAALSFLWHLCCFFLFVLVLIGSMYSVNPPGSLHAHTLSAERLCVAGSCHKGVLSMLSWGHYWLPPLETQKILWTTFQGEMLFVEQGFCTTWPSPHFFLIFFLPLWSQEMNLTLWFFSFTIN